MALIVQKFGGTSLADISKIQKAAKIVSQEQKNNNKIVVVVSAMAGITNSLINSCNKVSKLNSRHHMLEYDSVVSSGEIVTSGLLALELQRLGKKSRSVQSWQIPIITDNIFADAKVKSINHEFILSFLERGIVPIITGFQGITTNQNITTLGKGGSDISAALISAAINADRVDIYTDVQGVFTADPRIVHKASKIDYIPIDQMLALSTYGAKVLHPRAVMAAQRYKFDIRVLSSFDKNTEVSTGTLISSKKHQKKIKMENKLITAITSDKNIIQINISGILDNFTEVIEKFAKESLIIDKIEFHHDQKNLTMMATLADKNKFDFILDSLKSNCKISSYEIRSNISTVTAIGYSIKSNNNLFFEVISLLNQQQINFENIHSNETSFTITLEDQDTEKVIKLLHKSYIAKQ